MAFAFSHIVNRVSTIYQTRAATAAMTAPAEKVVAEAWPVNVGAAGGAIDGGAPDG